jgi:putative phosphoesterase
MCYRSAMRVGVISDTHGLLRPQALAALDGSDLILHAGDVGDPTVLDALGQLAPVRAVRGNNDRGGWAAALPETDVVELPGGLFVYLIHDVEALDLDPAAARLSAVVAGHSHRPRNEIEGGVLYFNPGSAGPRRFRLPVTLGRIESHGGVLIGTIVPLASDS